VTQSQRAAYGYEQYYSSAMYTAGAAENLVRVYKYEALSTLFS